MSNAARLVAHRGYAHAYPENTQLAIQAAVTAGALWVEFDIQLSADKIPVLFHDNDLQRMCRQPGPVHEYTLQQLQAFSCGEFARFGDKYADNRITALAELVVYLRSQPQVHAFVELKDNSIEQFGVATVVEQVLQCIAPIAQQCIIISYHYAALAFVKKHYTIPIGAVFDCWSEQNKTAIKDLDAPYWFTDIDELPRQGSLAVTGKKVAVYECTDPLQAQQLYERGVDLVETFDIAMMQQAIKSV